MNSWKVILATMVIFGAGVVTGGLLVKHAAGPARVKPLRNTVYATNPPPANIAPAHLQRMELLLRVRNELNLSPEQHERIERIVRDGQERSRKIWDAVAPEMRKELQGVHEKIRSELTPQQRRRFEELLSRPPRGVQNPNAPMNNPPPQGDRLRERQRQGAPGEPVFGPSGQQGFPRRDIPPGAPRPAGGPGLPPSQAAPPSESPPPANH